MLVCASNPSSAIQRLAPELLSEVFLQCLSEDETSSMRHFSRSPLLLGRVCSAWRTISHSTAALWTHLTIGEDFHTISRPDYTKDGVAMWVWIKRSRSLPLSVRISFGRSARRSDFTEQSLETLLMIVQSQSSRWKRLDATIPVIFEGILITPFCVKNVAMLENVAIRIWGTWPSGGRMTELKFPLSAAPRLRYFDLLAESNVRVIFDGPAHDIKCLNFLHRYGVKTHQADLMECLTYCTSLSTLSFHLHPSSPHGFHAILKHTYLESLRLEIHLACDLGLLFHHLVLPALTELILEMDEDEEAVLDWPHLLTLLKYSRPPLTSLILIGRIPMTETTLIECIKYTPGLRIAIVSGVRCTDTTLRAFTVDDSDSSTILCPSLQKLNLGIESRFSRAAVEELILSRWGDHRSKSYSPPVPRKELAELWVGYIPNLHDISSDPAIAVCISEGFRLGSEG
ncbi:hypothetical protein BD410DRAFT_792268 [Rickenella mellea]|uniref:F-box domain-containing protein n=1 Tax=Rickenella mellea TaxID=50990 RepID=A0A4Y7PW00_9AGAM|nr:hypothetical protein BD410DRAFT_792268 [Rickenella mellea]